MIDHLTLPVTDFEVSRAFYEQALRPLGYVYEPAKGCLSHKKKRYFWMGQCEVVNGIHLAFTAKDRAAVDAFYKAAILAGGVDNGRPGVRSYHVGYYAAFVLDPDGHNIEAVFHGTERA